MNSQSERLGEGQEIVLDILMSTAHGYVAVNSDEIKKSVGKTPSSGLTPMCGRVSAGVGEVLTQGSREG